MIIIIHFIYRPFKTLKDTLQIIKYIINEKKMHNKTQNYINQKKLICKNLNSYFINVMKESDLIWNRTSLSWANAKDKVICPRTDCVQLISVKVE